MIGMSAGLYITIIMDYNRAPYRAIKTSISGGLYTAIIDLIVWYGET
jgi:hypothetical protein